MPNTNDAIFDEFLEINNYPKRFSPPKEPFENEVLLINLLESAGPIFEAINRSDVSIKPLNPTVYVLDAFSLNAFAAIYKNQEFIGVNSGLILTLYQLFYRILAHPDILINIGDPSKEVEPPALKHLPTSLAHLRNVPPVIPRDPMRNMLADRMHVLAMTFLFVHEVAHLRNGHVDFAIKYQLSKSGPINVLEEISPSVTHDINLTRQALELNADWFAITSLANTIINESKKFGKKAGFLSSMIELNVLLSSVYLGLRLFYDAEQSTSKWELGNLDSRTHLPTPIRFFVIFDMLMGHLMLQYRYTDIRIPELLLRNTYNFGEFAVENLLGTSNSEPFVEAERLMKEAAFPHTEKIEARWKEILPELRLLAKANNLPEYHTAAG